MISCRTLTILSSFILLIMSGSCTDHKHETKMVLQSFENYTHAISANLGNVAIKYVDSATINYYDALIPVIINADSETVDRLRFDQQILVLLIRHTTSYNKISKMNGRQLFEYAVQTGLCGGSDPGKFKPSVVITGENTAALTLINKESKLATPILFYRENGIWKIDLPSISAKFGNQTWDVLQENSGLSKKELIGRMLEQSNNVAPGNRIWHPVTEDLF